MKRKTKTTKLRPVWKGMMRFSLVSIPVVAVTAKIKGSKIDLDWLHEKCAGIAQVVLFRRERVMLIRPLDEILVMTALTYEEQFKKPSLLEAELPKAKIAPRELELARTLVDSLTAKDFDYSTYHDPYV